MEVLNFRKDSQRSLQGSIFVMGMWQDLDLMSDLYAAIDLMPHTKPIMINYSPDFLSKFNSGYKNNDE